MRVFPRRQCKTVSNLHLKAVCDFLLHKYLQARKGCLLCACLSTPPFFCALSFLEKKLCSPIRACVAVFPTASAEKGYTHAQRLCVKITFKKLLCAWSQPAFTRPYERAFLLRLASTSLSNRFILWR